MAPFYYGWGSTASRLQPLRRGSLLFTIQFPEISGIYTVYIKKLGQFFSHTLLVIHHSTGSYKYFEKLISEV